MHINQGDIGRFAGYMLIGLFGFLVLGGLTPLVFAVAILFIIVIVVACLVGLGKD